MTENKRNVLRGFSKLSMGAGILICLSMSLKSEYRNQLKLSYENTKDNYYKELQSEMLSETAENAWMLGGFALIGGGIFGLIRTRKNPDER